MNSSSASDSVKHLEPSLWAASNRHLVAKALAEFSHELLLEPKALASAGGWTSYSVGTDDPNVEYRFRARLRALDHWHVDRDSIRRCAEGRDTEVDAAEFISELRRRLAIPDAVLPEYLQELSCTLFSAAYKRAFARAPARELALAGFQELEAGMSEGHPVFVANNARVGFNALDYRAYAPETAAPIKLHWLAARKAIALVATSGVSFEELLRGELGDDVLARFRATIEARASDPADYVFVPVHPWQWQNRIQQLFAGDLARGDLVYFGAGSDEYQAQQSIRTLFNATHSERHYVKTALSILNMGFTRGMPPAIATSAVAVNDWVAALVEGDPYLRDCGFSLLREVAYVGVKHRHYEKASRAKHEPYKEMLAALWRESPVSRLGPGERLMTMAALLHVDAQGDSLLTSLIAASGLSVDDWIRAYLDAYLRPLLHCFYRHSLTFTPHCENVILVLENHRPVRIFIKDIAEDVGVLNPEQPLPEQVRRIGLTVPEEVMTLVIFTDVFDCVFRFLGPLLVEHTGLSESRFWWLVAECIERYRVSMPELERRFERYDLFAPTFLRNCLNRLQLKNNRVMVDLNAPEPVDSLQFVGMLDNPIAEFREQVRARALMGGEA